MASLPAADWPLIACLASAGFLAVVVPVLMVAVRHEIRVQRLETLVQFRGIFGKGADTPSFEYVWEKYLEDIDLGMLKNAKGFPESEKNKRTLTKLSSEAITAAIRQIGWRRLHSSWSLVWSAVPYMVLTWAGLILLLACNGQDPLTTVLIEKCRPLITSGGIVAPSVEAAEIYFRNVLTVSAMAFLGGYVFTLGTLARAVATFDLSPITMLRVVIHLITAVAGALVAYRAFPDAILMFGDMLNLAESDGVSFKALPRPWYLAAFVFGLIPDLVINVLISATQRMAGAKTPEGRAFQQLRSVPLDVIDGVDFFTRFRMQQSNIFEVQNLAVANPIMLFVETPFGVYQCIDWVGQAQLCCVVGPDRFIALRRYNIRTIFDLERAILSVNTTSQLRRFVVTLMLTTPPERKRWRLRGAKPQDAAAAAEGKAAQNGGGDSAGWMFWIQRPDVRASEARKVGSAEFGAYAAQLFAESAHDWQGKDLAGDDPDRTLKHLGRIVTDDLHVHRLRQIWSKIQGQLGSEYGALPDTEAPPVPSPRRRS